METQITGKVLIRVRRSSGILGSVDLWLDTDVSGQPGGPIFKGQAAQEEFHS